MALLAPVIAQTASSAQSGKLFVSCPGAAVIYVNSTLWSDRSQSQLESTVGDSTSPTLPLPPVGAGVTAYGTDALVNAGPVSSTWVVY